MKTSLQWKLCAILSLICCTAFFLPRGAAFSRESIRIHNKASPMPRRETQIQPSPQYCSSARLNLLQNKLQRSAATLLRLSREDSPAENDESGSDGGADDFFRPRLGKKEGRSRAHRSAGGRGFARRGANSTSTAVMDAPQEALASDREIEMTKRITQLEHLVAKQTVEIRRLQDQCRKLTEASETFASVVELLRAAGLQTDDYSAASKGDGDKPLAEEPQEPKDSDLEEDVEGSGAKYEYFDDTEIFGDAPSSVTDAADAAGAAILAGLLGGKQRMLVDVRDSELSRDPETLVQFIELAILPVAAGLEGLRSNRNRVKIVFPTVSQLLEYRRTMALAAPEVVALSTLGFDPVEERDNIVVIVAPPPDDEEGLLAMNELLVPTNNKSPKISQPVVVLNHHMVPLSGPAADFDVMYHLRLLSVQYMSGDRADAVFQQFEDANAADEDEGEGPIDAMNSTSAEGTRKPDEELLEAAMKHAQEAGVHHGMTRAMVIRSYPKPWHVFVDVSPDTDHDFVVADTFTEEPSPEEVNNAIVECLEGSEREDELVAQQMQETLDLDMKDLDMKNGKFDLKNGASEDADDNEEDDEEFDDWYDLWNEDSV